MSPHAHEFDEQGRCAGCWSGPMQGGIMPGGILVQPTFGADWPEPPLHPIDLQPVTEKRGKWSRAHIVARRLQRGEHPLGKAMLAVKDESGYGHTCGDCHNLVINIGKSRRYYKCRFGPVSSGSATDVRLRWPACRRWAQAQPEEVGLDGH